MTFANLKSTGSGRIRARLTIYGLPSVFVSAATMTQAVADELTWINGLDVSTIKFGCTADIARATISAEGFTATIKDHGGLVTAVLAKRPQQVTTLIASIDDNDAAINVDSTAGFASKGTIHIATEAINYNGITATQFQSCTRGVWGTTAQFHYVPSAGPGLQYPRVTDHPVGLEGRSCEVAFYGDGDSGTGNGSIVFRGVCATGAKFSRGVWTIGIDPITRILDQNIGADLNDPTPIRGIHYTTAAPLRLIISTGREATDRFCIIPLTGFFADQQAFCDELTDRIAAAIAGTTGWNWNAGSELVAQPDGDAGWSLVYTTGSAGTPKYLYLDSTTRLGREAGVPTASSLDTQIDTEWIDAAGNVAGVASIAVDTAYRMRWSAPVPRATIGNAVESWFTDGVSNPEFRLYLGGTVIPTTSMHLAFEGGDLDGRTAIVDAIDATDRTMDVRCPFAVLGPETKIRLGRVLLAEGHVGDLRTALIADSPEFCNVRAMPLLTSTDIVATLDAGQQAAAHTAIGWNRTFVAFGTHTVGEVFSHELRAIGCYMRLYGGSIQFKKIRATATSDTADHEIGESDLLRDSWPSIERGQFGIMSAVEMKTGWDPKEDEHKGTTYRFEDVGAASSNRITQTLEIAQRSLAPTGWRALRDVGTLTTDNVRSAVMPVLGLFATEYDVIQVTVGMRYFDALIGESVSLTSSKVPNVDGTMGVTDELCMIVGAGYDAGRITLQLLRHGQRINGYAPSFRIDNGGVSTVGVVVIGSIDYDLTCQMSDYTDRTNASDWFTIGDLVSLVEQDAAAPVTVDAAIVSFPSAGVIRIRVTPGPFVYGTAEWMICPRISSSYAETDPLARFAFQALTTHRVTFSSGGVAAGVFAP